MTSGDGGNGALQPERSAGEVSAMSAASAAELSFDSDDLLTSRRGGRPAEPPQPSDSHSEAPAGPAESYLVGPEMAAPLEVVETVEHVPAAPVEHVPAAPVEHTLAEPHEAGEDAAVAPLSGLSNGHEADVPVDDWMEMELVPERSDGAAAVAPTASAAPTVQETVDPAAEGVAAAPVGTSVATLEAPARDTTEAEPASVADTVVRTNGIGVHAASTAEYPVATPFADDGAASARWDADVLSGPSTGEVFDVPVPMAEGPVGATDDASAAVAVLAPPEEQLSPPVTQLLAEPIILADPDIPVSPPPEPPAPPLAASPPPPPAAPPPEDGAEEDGATMTIIEHLEELRRRVTRSAIAIVLGAVAGWFVAPPLVHYLQGAAVADGATFVSLSLLGPFGLQIKLAFIAGVVFASPIVLYQIWAFVAPGLTRKERRYALPFSLIGGLLFAGGAVTGVLIIPLAIRFLASFFSVFSLEKLLSIDTYIMFIALIAVIFGVTFELPIFMVGFSLLGVVNSRFFIQKFKIAIFVIYGVSMVITPGADLISPLVLGTFLIVLYWFGVLLIRVIGR